MQENLLEKRVSIGDTGERARSAPVGQLRAKRAGAAAAPYPHCWFNASTLESPMPRTRIVLALAWALVTALMLTGTATAQTVWSGFDFSFSRPNDADPMLPQNQDRITDNVWLTRLVQEGLFNIRQETSYALTSPADTQWATDLMSANAGETIAAANWADLSFANWIDAYGGQGGMTLPARLTSRNAVVHLITDDIYLDIQFTAWTSGAGGGGFSYDRAAAPPSPTTTGDYNGNGVVDAADYVVWRDTLNQSAAPPGSGADGIADGFIDSADYDFWRAHFGEIVPTGSGTLTAAAVPEPAAFMLTLVGLISFFGFPCAWQERGSCSRGEHHEKIPYYPWVGGLCVGGAGGDPRLSLCPPVGHQ